MSSESVRRYVIAHWRGRHGLWWSAAVNLAGLRTLFFPGVAFAGQAVGVIRAGGNI